MKSSKEKDKFFQNLLKEEKRLWQKGYKQVVGLDEVGRGSLAGPVVAVALTITSLISQKKYHSFISFFSQDLKMKDSKKLSPQQREKLYNILICHPQIKWAMGKVSEKIIDKINILEATKLAMVRALKNLRIKSDFVIIDGNFTFQAKSSNIWSKIFNLKPSQKPKKNQNFVFSLEKIKNIIKADEKVLSCLLASILAKVIRDKMIKRLYQKFPQYGFDKHKGYPTKLHLEMLKRYGPCKIHRKSFKPIKISI